MVWMKALLAGAAAATLGACAQPRSTLVVAEGDGHVRLHDNTRVVVLRGHAARELRRKSREHAHEARAHAREARRLEREAHAHAREGMRVALAGPMPDPIIIHVQAETARRIGEAGRIAGEQARRDVEALRPRIEELRRQAERLRRQCERGEIACEIIIGD